jgi:hypothetical protein
MADILAVLSVEVGDRFVSADSATTLEVVKIWFEFSMVDNRWETSVAWNSSYGSGNNLQLSSKGRDFVQRLKEGGFVRVRKAATSSDGITTTPSSVVTTGPLAGAPLPSTPSVDQKRRQWEADFRQHAAKYGLAPTDLGRKISLGKNRTKNYTIVGAKPRNWKMPILIQGRRGGVYKITAEKAKAGLV